MFNSVDEKYFRIITNMYESMMSCVKINGETSTFLPASVVFDKVRTFPPVLYALYLNDLESFLLSGGVETLDFELLTDEINMYLKVLLLLYADDTVIFSNNEHNFKECLNEFSEYCKFWKLNINYNKTEIVVFNSRNNSNYTFKKGEHTIQFTNKYKYLGVILLKSGSFLNASKHLAEQAIKAMQLLFIRANNLDFPIDLQFKLFDYTVMPILTYLGI